MTGGMVVRAPVPPSGPIVGGHRKAGPFLTFSARVGGQMRPGAGAARPDTRVMQELRRLSALNGILVAPAALWAPE